MNYTYIITVLLFAILFIGCEEDSPGSLFDPDDRGNPAPQITTVDPPDGSLAGVGIITITQLRARIFHPQPITIWSI